MQNKYKVFFLAILLALVSCSSNLSNNKVSQGIVDFPGGRNGIVSWEDTLTFKRFSWYRGVTLSYDLLAYKVLPTSKFVNWFSKDEKNLLKTCKDLVITINYSARHALIKHSDFNILMKDTGFETVSVRRFAHSIKAHPAFEAWNLQQYKINGFCHKTQTTSNLVVNFPSFPEGFIKF